MVERIGITMRVARAVDYGEARDCIAQDWAGFLSAVLPRTAWMLIPNLGRRVGEYVEKWKLEGFILSGGNDIGENPLRDETERTILDLALHSNRPLLGICRGMQMIQHHLGGRMEECSASRHAGRLHPVEVLPQERFSPPGGNRMVNSFHHYGVKKEDLSPALRPLAVAEDGILEAIYHPKASILGIQWHPERMNPVDMHDREWLEEIFRKRKD